MEGLKPFRIYLFGSRAEGRARPDSDFDLVVVFDDEEPNSEADYDEVFAPVLDLPIGCDIIPCRRSDFQEVQCAEKIARAILSDAGVKYGTGHNLAHMA